MKKQVSRRTIVKLGALLSSFSFIPTNLLGLDLTEFKTGFQNADIYHFKVGKFKCTCIRDFDVTYPFENFFKDVPKELVEEALRNLGAPTDLVHTPLTHLVVDTGKNKILVFCLVMIPFDNGFISHLFRVVHPNILVIIISLFQKKRTGIFLVLVIVPHFGLRDKTPVSQGSKQIEIAIGQRLLVAQPELNIRIISLCFIVSTIVNLNQVLSINIIQY